MINLYYYNWQLQENVFGVVMDDIKERYEQDEIYFVSCRGALLPCWSNMVADPLKCEICRFNQKSAFSSDFKRVKQLYIDDYSDVKEVENEFILNNIGNYSNFDEIRALEYKGISIGYAALSSYISATRNRDILINSEFKAYFDKLLKTQIFIKIAIDSIIDELKPEVISIFNGRIHDTRPVFQTALQKKIKLRGVETVIKGDFDFYRTIFDDALPHDINFQTQLINKTWNQSSLSLPDKIKSASQFYENRRNNILTRDVKVYTSNQETGRLPDNWDVSKRNIAIFNSSEDEYASIGKDWDNISLFENQEIGINYILQNVTNSDIHFYLRIHPNLIEVNYGYHLRLYDLEKKYDNITVIEAKSLISTYTLMDNCEKVIVFGSTVGVEACYGKKPVILLAGTFYYYLDVAYIPTHQEEVITLIQTLLKAKEIEGALKFGFYLMETEGYSKPISFNAKPLFFFGQKLGYTFPHLKFLGSSRLHKLLLLFLRIKYKIQFYLNKQELLIIPKQEL